MDSRTKYSHTVSPLSVFAVSECEILKVTVVRRKQKCLLLLWSINTSHLKLTVLLNAAMNTGTQPWYLSSPEAAQRILGLFGDEKTVNIYKMRKYFLALSFCGYDLIKTSLYSYIEACVILPIIFWKHQNLSSLFIGNGIPSATVFTAIQQHGIAERSCGCFEQKLS